MPLTSLVARATAASVAGLILLGWIGYARYLADPSVPSRVPPPPARAGPPLTDRVVVVLVDGLREEIAFDEALCRPSTRWRSAARAAYILRLR